MGLGEKGDTAGKPDLDETALIDVIRSDAENSTDLPFDEIGSTWGRLGVAAGTPAEATTGDTPVKSPAQDGARGLRAPRPQAPLEEPEAGGDGVAGEVVGGHVGRVLAPNAVGPGFRAGCPRTMCCSCLRSPFSTFRQ